MADEDLPLGGTASKFAGKKKIIIIAAIALMLLVIAGALTYFLVMKDDKSAAQNNNTEEVIESTVGDGDSTYVAMPRPFVFNVMDGKRDRLVQIKVQLMVRGSDNEALAKKHIPLLEGTLVRIFGAATASQLRSPDGKDQLREYAQQALNDAIRKLEGRAVVDTVLFTGFVLQ